MPQKERGAAINNVSRDSGGCRGPGRMWVQFPCWTLSPHFRALGVSHSFPWASRTKAQQLGLPEPRAQTEVDHADLSDVTAQDPHRTLTLTHPHGLH